MSNFQLYLHNTTNKIIYENTPKSQLPCFLHLNLRGLWLSVLEWILIFLLKKSLVGHIRQKFNTN